MNRFNRSLLAVAVAGGLCGGVGFVHAGFVTNAQAAQQLDEHWKYPHMHHALEHLKEARSELEQTEEIFKGHRGEALEHVDHAIKEIGDGLHEQSDEAALPGTLPPSAKLDETQFPHMHAALDRLRDARKELDDADKIFGGHRDVAIDQTDKAINQLKDAIHDAEK